MKDKNDTKNQVEETTVKTPANTATPLKKSKGATGPVVLTVLAAALLGGGALWYIQQNQSQLTQQYDSQLNLVVQQAKQNEQVANQALNLVQNQAKQIQRMSQDLAKTREELGDISAAIQVITDSGSDLMLLNDVEQLVVLAQQQLAIGGSLANAIVSLETAQARLSQADRQGLAILLQTLNGDLDRLRAAQVVDVATVTSQLDRLAELLNQAPLYVPDSKNSSINGEKPEAKPSTPVAPVDPENTEATPLEGEGPWWQQTLDSAMDLTQKGWHTIRQDLGQFVSVRRVDDSAALLMSAEQAERFRDNLSLRVTMAQLALMTKQPKVWDAEMGRIVEALEQRFDPSLAVTQRALALATKLADTDIDIQLPTISNTLAAIERLKQAEQSGFEGQNQTDEDKAVIQPSPEAAVIKSSKPTDEQTAKEPVDEEKTSEPSAEKITEEPAATTTVAPAAQPSESATDSAESKDNMDSNAEPDTAPEATEAKPESTEARAESTEQTQNQASDTTSSAQAPSVSSFTTQARWALQSQVS
ncbi:MAG TPA: hypothetical protein GXX62_01715 [Alcaligenaceae bacterium]|nr:hypothetical protein [Alcaligenaceae bacterium]